MAIKIIRKPPKYFRIECPYCCALLEYELADVECRYIKCPCCSEYMGVEGVAKIFVGSEEEE